MPLSRRFLLAIGAAAALAGAGWTGGAQASEPLPVVATFSILGDMVAAIGGERVRVTTLVGPDGDAHVFQPTPRDARAVSDSALVFANGLGFEGWIDRLILASGFRGAVVQASAGVEPMAASGDGREHGHDHGPTAVDPHAWHDLANGKIYAANIAAGLIGADPDHRSTYEANLDTYIAEITAVERELAAALGSLPPSRRRVVTPHDSFSYFARAYGFAFVAPQGFSTEAEASARDVAALIRLIRQENIRAVFVENVSDPRLIEQIRQETGARIGGTLYSDALSGQDGPAPTYLAMMRHNIRTLAEALAD